MKQISKSPFRVKNGKRFQNVLIKVAEGDNNISKMFIDNFNRSEDAVIQSIVEGKFQDALFLAFDWNTSNEKYDFWNEIFDNMGE